MSGHGQRMWRCGNISLCTGRPPGSHQPAIGVRAFGKPTEPGVPAASDVSWAEHCHSGIGRMPMAGSVRLAQLGSVPPALGSKGGPRRERSAMRPRDPFRHHRALDVQSLYPFRADKCGRWLRGSCPFPPPVSSQSADAKTASRNTSAKPIQFRLRQSALSMKMDPVLSLGWEQKENATLVGVALVCGRFESPVGPSLPAPHGRKPSRGLARRKAGARSDLLRRGNIFEVTEDRADDRRDFVGSGRPEDIDLGIVGETRINHHPH